MSQLSVSGAVSGLDTASIINQLVAVDQRQQQLLNTRMSAVQKTSDAYGRLITSLRSLSTQASALATTSSWSGTVASSSSSSVSVTATGTTPQSLTFDVTSVAAAHSLVSAGTVTGTADVVASSGSITLTGSDGTPQTLDVGGGSLAEVVTRLNQTGTGVRAAAVQVAPGSYRLQVTAAASGEASAFTLDGLDGFPGFDVLAQGQDAVLSVGADAQTAYEVRSSSNTFSSVLPDLTFTVTRPETGVTVSSTVDGSRVADDVQALVTSMNAVLGDITQQTKWNPDTRTGGPLLGESAVRRLQQNVLSVLSDAGAAGVSLKRDGTVSFDRAAFLEAFSADPAAVAQQFGAKATFEPAAGVSGSASITRAAATTRTGTYAVHLTASAAREQWRVDPPGGSIAGQTVVIVRGSQVVSYTAGAGDTLADAVNAITARAASAGLTVSAALTSGAIVLTAASTGASQAFSVTLDGNAATRVTAGRDVAGTIDGQAATGTGSLLTGAPGTGSGAAGLALSLAFDDADVAASGGDVGTVNFQPGLAQRLVGLVDDATSSTGGILKVAQDGRDATVKDLQTQVDAWDRRLEARRLQLTRTFATLETTLSSLRSQTSALSSLTTTSG